MLTSLLHSGLTLDQAIKAEVIRYVVACERHEMPKAHVRLAAVKRLKAAKFDLEHPINV